MSDTFATMDYSDWFDKYKPLKNHLDDYASMDGYLFMPYGKEWEHVSRVSNNNIWTLILTDREDDITSFDVINGVRVVDREGYFITKVPYEKEALLLVHDE